jgi:hypothetical protein
MELDYGLDSHHQEESNKIRETGLKLQRKQRLEALIIKRKSNFSYIYRIYNGDSFWLNCVLVTNNELSQYRLVAPKQRILMYYYLGISTSKLLMDNLTGINLVRSFAQLLDEWEYCFAGTAMQSVKFVMAKNSVTPYPETTLMDNDTHENIAKTTIYKFNGSVVYEHLIDQNMPFELDYIEVVHSLAVSLSNLYEYFLHVDCYTNLIVYDLIVKLDLRIKHHFINLIAKEMTENCINDFKNEMMMLRNMAGAGMR